MRRRTWVWIGVYVAATAVLAAGIVALVRDDRADERASSATVEELPDLLAMPFPTTLSLRGPATTAIGSQVRLGATSYSTEGAKTIELWDGARRVATVEPTSGGSSGDVVYPALSVGPHALFAQVTDVGGKVSQSAVVEVTVAPVAAEQTLPVPVQPDEGETPDELARRFGVEPAQVVATAPGAVAVVPGEPSERIGGSAPITAGASVFIEVKGDTGLAPTIGKDAFVTGPATLPGAVLELSGRTEGCDVVLTAKSSDGAVFYFDANAGVPGWASVGETPGDGDLRLVALDPGVHVYKARTDKLTAAPVSVTVPTACADGTGWRGTASIVDGSLVLPKDAAGFVWLYLSVDGKPTVRAPLSQDEWIDAGLITPVAYALPPLSGRRLVLEVWKVSDGDLPPLAPVAKGVLDVPPSKSMTDVVGEPSGITLTVSSPTDTAGSFKKLGQQDEPLNFEWVASSDRVAEVLWQVTTSPHPSSDHDLVPPDLIAAGTSKLSSATGAGTKGTFTINSEDIPGRDFTGGEAVYHDSLKPKTTFVTPPVTAGGVMGLTSATFASALPETGVTEAQFAVAQAVDLPSFGDPVYVRVVAKPQGPAVGAGSTTVRIELPVPQGQNGAKVDFRLASPTTFDPGRRPNDALAACVAVIVPWNGDGRTSSIDGGKTQMPLDPTATPPPGGWTLQSLGASAFYPRSGTYCPSDFPQPASCANLLCDVWAGIVEATDFVVDRLKEAYSIVASTWNGLIDYGIDLAAEVGWCEVTGAIKGGDKTTEGCKKVLRYGGRAVVTAVLAYYGLPAHLPTVEELEAVGKGELVKLAVGAMEYYGVPCEELKTDPEALAALAKAAGEDPAIGEAAGDPCTALAKYLLAKIQEQVENYLEAGVASATGLPSVSGIPGASMKLEPKGQPTPARLDLAMEVVKSNADASGMVCLARVEPRVRYGFDDKGNPKYLKPIGPEIVKLTELAPLDGTGTWQGSVVLANAYHLEGRQRSFKAMELSVTSAPGSPCSFEPFVIGPEDLSPPQNR